MKRYCCHCGRYKTLDTFRNSPGVLCLFPTPPRTGPFWCRHGACGRVGRTTLRVLCPTKAHAKVLLIGIEGAIAQRTRKRCSAVRQMKLKVLQRISQCRSATKPLEKELAQTLKHCRQRFNKLQSTHRALLHALDKSRIRCKQLLSRKIKLTADRDAWRSRATTSFAEARRLRRQAGCVTMYMGGRLKAFIRYMYYRMFQEAASENGANNTILAVPEGLGVTLPTCLPARRAKHKLRLEAGVWDTFCAICKMCAAKQDATQRGVPFSISKGRDGTTCHVCVVSGIHLVA